MRPGAMFGPAKVEGLARARLTLATILADAGHSSYFVMNEVIFMIDVR